jgi:subtilisin family serine protease
MERKKLPRRKSPSNKSTRVPVIEGEWKGKKEKFRPDRIIVKLKIEKKNLKANVAKKKSEEIRSMIPDSKVLRYPLKTPVFVLKVPDKTNIAELAEKIAERDDVAYAEPDFIGEICLTPNDPRFDDQWGLEKIGAESAWDLETGASGILIGVIDTGIATDTSGALNHPDLDDTTRYILGTDFVSDDALPRDDHGHGTHVAGIAAAETDNSEGIAGMNWGSPVYICKVFDSVGSGAASDVEAAVQEIVDYALDNNLLAVINMSARWTSPATALNDACEYAHDNNMIFCIATGNDSGSVGYPAAYSPDFEGVIAVGRTSDDDTVYHTSNSGPEVIVVAPGSDILSTMPTYDVTSNSDGYSKDYDEMSGTSMASPLVAGLAALVWSREPRQTNEQVRDVLVNTAKKLGAGDFDNSWGYGRIDAEKAVAKAGWDITLEYPTLEFIDIPESETTVRAIKFLVKSFHATTFEIIQGPTGVFDTILGASTSLGKSTDYDTPREAYIWVSYTGTSAGDSHTGTVKVRCNETQEEWELDITANTVTRPTACVMLTFDRSNSMNWDSGIDGYTRVEVLRYSANVFVDVIQEGNAAGIVAFDHDPHDVLIPVIGPLGPPAIFDPDRNNLRSAINLFSPNPLGNTAIGDGIERAHERLSAVSGYDKEAILVLTDGKETASKYIADVSDLIDEQVFAVGLGRAENINPSALNQIANGTGGYVLLTDQLDNNSRFKLAKYFLQILAGVNNEDIVVDPDGWIGPGELQRIPFHLNESDISCDVILIVPSTGTIRLMLETPEGDRIDASTPTIIPTIHLFNGSNVTFYRTSLPVPLGVSPSHGGKWHAILQGDAKYYDNYLNYVEKYPKVFEAVKAHGVQYTLLVHTYSNLRMRCTIAQDSYEPGAVINLRAVLSEYGVPIQKDASVRADLIRPDKTSTTLLLSEVEQGAYESSIVASQTGTYQFRVMADGYTMRNRRFTRQQVVNGAVWKGGDLPFPESDTPDGFSFDIEQTICRLLSCMDKNLSDELHKRLLRSGVDLRGLIRCFCYENKKPGFGKLDALKLDRTEVSKLLKLLGEEIERGH